MNIFDNEDTELLIKAFISIENEDECKAFIEDVMTTKEILDIAQRLRVAEMLRKKTVYSKISLETGASTATISRVNRCCTYGTGGYEKILNKIEK